MRVRLTLDVDELTRYVVARHFRVEDGSKRTRATRGQVKRFVDRAVRDAVADRLGTMGGRARAVARRLQAGETYARATAGEPLSEERQGSLW